MTFFGKARTNSSPRRLSSIVLKEYYWFMKLLLRCVWQKIKFYWYCSEFIWNFVAETIWFCWVTHFIKLRIWIECWDYTESIVRLCWVCWVNTLLTLKSLIGEHARSKFWRSFSRMHGLIRDMHAKKIPNFFQRFWNFFRNFGQKSTKYRLNFPRFYIWISLVH